MDPNTMASTETTNHAALMPKHVSAAKTEPMIKNTTHSSIGCNGMANNDPYYGLWWSSIYNWPYHNESFCDDLNL